jgi:hypothetical protein
MPLLRLHADVVLVPVRLREAAPPPALVPAVEPRTTYSLPRPVPGRRVSLDEARRLVSESERDLKALPAPIAPTASD